MKLKLIFGVALIPVLLTLEGCVSYPQTAAVYRQQVQDSSFFGEKKSFIVKRNFKKVVSTYRKMANKCLNLKVMTKSNSYMASGTSVDQYKATFSVSKNKAELHVQKSIGSVLTPGEVPKNGLYIFVVDIKSMRKNKTKIDMYSGSFGVTSLASAIKGWSTGKNIGCPDLTKL